ncbi:IS1634 family transposase [Mycoplasma sp. HU2014]|uniref:IS1634 family transposase n=1 Tax=Mycoplasma sp. HU2014 TaxID=1664275 RepID=UPI00067DB384|nr:IS1634 family transposase [Mycoplasma sp. HU2014]KNG78981.1 IS1634-related transposase [Mycoplasma sp. HU2014]
MIKRDKIKFKDGTVKTYFRVVRGYRDKDGKVKQEIVKSFGYLEDQLDQNKFIKEVEEFNKNALKGPRITFSEIKDKSFLDNPSSISYNFGYKYLEAVYQFLELDDFFATLNYKTTYSINEIFKFLVLQRIMSPASRRSTYKKIEYFYNKDLNFPIHAVYRCLDYIDKHSDELQKHLNKVISSKIGRNAVETFFDSTNFYFEKDFEDADVYEEVFPLETNKKIINDQQIISIKDGNTEKQYKKITGLLKRGVSKEHVVDPIVQLGLMMDSNGIPISYKIFPGNTSDSRTLLPVLNEVKSNYNLERTVIVADKGINCQENIKSIVKNGDGYLFSQILKGKKGKKYQEKMFDESLYKTVSSDYKYQEFIEPVTYFDENNKKVTVKQKVLIWWDGKRARRDIRKINEKVLKAQNAIKYGVANLTHSYTKYIETQNYSSITGEIANKKQLIIDVEKIEKDLKFAGYSCIVTSELEYDHEKIRDLYHGLAKIEDAFRITKNDLATRPMFVRTKEHINAHILICYVSLVILRIIFHKLNGKLSVERIIESLNMCSCSNISGGIVYVFKNDEKQCFEIKQDQNGKDYSTTKIINDSSQTVEDFKLLSKLFEKTNTIKSLMTDVEFDKILNSIRFK